MSAVPIIKQILIYGGILAIAIAIVGSVVGPVIAGGVGPASALIGTVMAVVFLGITAASIVVDRVTLARAGWTIEDRSHQASRTDRTLVPVKGSSS